MIGLIVHEFGHALCATALGVPVSKVQLGGGRSLLNPQLEATVQHLDNGQLDQARAEEARRIFQGLVDAPRMKAVQPTVLNNLAYADLIIGDPDLVAEADEMSARALGGREVGAFLDTRAWALIETGQIAAGTRMAQRALNYSNGRSRAHTQCVLALAAARSGDGARAEALLAAAGGVLAADDPVLRRISRSVAAEVPAALGGAVAGPTGKGYGRGVRPAKRR